MVIESQHVYYVRGLAQHHTWVSPVQLLYEGPRKLRLNVTSVIGMESGLCANVGRESDVFRCGHYK